MMNLTMKDIKVGDKFKQEKALGSYFFEDAEFIVASVDENKSAILLSFKSEKMAPAAFMYAQVYLSLNELNEAFKRSFSFIWSDWKIVDNEFNFEYECEYKTNGRITFVKILHDNKVFKGKAACHKDDLGDFDENTGIIIAYHRAKEKVEKYLSNHFKVGDRVQAINNNCVAEYVYENATGTIITLCDNSFSAKVEWDVGCAKGNTSIDRRWYIPLTDLKLLTKQDNNFNLEYITGDIFSAPIFYTLLHTTYAESEGNAVGLTKDIINIFNLKEDLKDELDYLLNVADYYVDYEDVNGDIITYSHKNVITLVTKRCRFDKVSYETIKRGLRKVKKHMESNNLHYLAMPCICCGYEKLQWEKIEELIKEVFSDCKIPITIRVYK